MSKLLTVFVLVGIFLYSDPAFAEMTSSNFKIRWDSVTTGGSDTASSASYSLRDSVGGPSVGTSTSNNYKLSAGYRAGVFDQVISFEILPQSVSDQRSVSSRSGLTISTTDTSSLYEGEFIALIQDRGAGQVSAVGKIAPGGISPGVSVTVDSWSDAGITPTIDGTDDYFSPLNGSSVAFGTLSLTKVTTAIIAFDVTTETENGYSVQLMQGGSLTSGSNHIAPVADGSVTAASEEYGARSSDTTLATSTFGSQDTAITSLFQDVATESTIKFNDRHFVTLKAAIASGTTAGTYTQTLTLIASGNF